MSPKDLFVESVRHHLLRAVERRASGPRAEDWRRLADGLELREEGGGLRASWRSPAPGVLSVERARFRLYERGAKAGGDPAADNRAAADEVAGRIAAELGWEEGAAPPDGARLERESRFHDEWAGGVDPAEVAVDAAFEACTAPEHRHILERLGDLKGLRLLDLGSGLGEASVYFAKRGAKVTSCDLSPGMLALTRRVAALHGVSVETHEGSAERTGLPADSFDVVYAGNLLHHVDVAAALDEIRRVLKPGGRFATWDPLAHNPAINVYRRMSPAVHTPDEHPLTMADLRLFDARFEGVERRGFWLTTLLIFVKFWLVDRADPATERYWKLILDRERSLRPLYSPLAALDRVLLALCPWLTRWCWNIVMMGRKPAR